MVTYDSVQYDNDDEDLFIPQLEHKIFGYSYLDIMTEQNW